MVDIDRTQAIVLGAAFLVAAAVVVGAAWYAGYLGFLSGLTSYLPFIGGGDDAGGEDDYVEPECEWPEIPDGDTCCIDENKNDFCDYLDNFADKETPVTTSEPEATTSAPAEESTTTTPEETTTIQTSETTTTAPQATTSTNEAAQTTTTTEPTTTTTYAPLTTTSLAPVATGVELVFRADQPIIPVYTDSAGFTLTVINIGEKTAERIRVMSTLPSKRVVQSTPLTFSLAPGQSRNVTVGLRAGMVADGQFILFTAETSDNQKFSQWLQVDVTGESRASAAIRETP